MVRIMIECYQEHLAQELRKLIHCVKSYAGSKYGPKVIFDYEPLKAVTSYLKVIPRKLLVHLIE